MEGAGAMGPSLFFDDLVVGQSFTTGTEQVTAEEIIAFARRWDPQPFHVDPVAAEASHFGGLVASGLHTLSQTFRLFEDLRLFRDSVVAGAGMEGVRFLAPVRAGDVLRVKVTVAEVRPTRRPDRGIVALRFETTNQDGVAVLAAELRAFIRRRSAGS